MASDIQQLHIEEPVTAESRDVSKEATKLMHRFSRQEVENVLLQTKFKA